MSNKRKQATSEQPAKGSLVAVQKKKEKITTLAEQSARGSHDAVIPI